jgi:hypothetical protein
MSVNPPDLLDFGADRIGLTIGMPYSSLDRHFRRRRESDLKSLERDFCRRRLARRKRLRDDISAPRPEIGDHHAREMAAKTAFSPTDLDAWVSVDCSNLRPAD